MIRRDFLKNAAAMATALAAKTSYAAPCAPPLDGAENQVCGQTSQSDLERRTRELTSGNTPILNVNYFRSEEGSPQIPNNRTQQQQAITWQVEGIYYDPIRRRMHQLDSQHQPGLLEHAYLDEASNTWVKVDTSALGVAGGQHWRASDFDHGSGYLYWQREGSNNLAIYDPDSGWSQVSASPNISSTDPGNGGFHPNLFGPNKPGFLTGRYNPTTFFVAYDTRNQTWSNLNSGGATDVGDVLYWGWSVYLPGRDELIMTDNGGGMIAFAAGAGLETGLSTANSASIRNNVPKAIFSSSGSDKCYACIHPRQPDVILAIDASGSTVYYTTDGATSAWQTAAFTHPFASELNSIGYCTVGSLPSHGVVAACDNTDSNNTRFVFWKPPLV